MPNPRTRHSKRRSRARRTHYKAELPTIATCKNTGEVHRFHTAYTHEGNLFYKGKMIVQGKAVAAEE
jgi:large subunit ribosomal protein L32